MPENLLLELESLSPPAETPEHIEAAIRESLQHMSQAIEGMQESVRDFEKIWGRIVLEVARGQTTEIHTARQRILETFEKRIRLLKQTHSVATWLRNLDEKSIPNPDVLIPVIAGLEKLKGRIFDTWATAEDLEDLAVRDYPLTAADLDRIGPQCQPPAAWYAEESQPF